MSIVAFIIGTLLPAISGLLLLTMLEGRNPALFFWERVALGFVFGLTFTMFLAFLCTVASLPLMLPVFLGVQIVVLAASFILRRFLPHAPLRSSRMTDASPAVSPWITITLQTLLLWVIVKAVISGVVFLLMTPTYLDDSLTNWDLRGKVYYVDHALTLVMPNEDPSTSPRGVSSYPPTVPLAKDWLAQLAGNWNDPLVNSIHILWYLCALALVYYAVRRYASREWAMLGAYILGSMPLYLMHGANAYADAFVSVHVFAAVSMLFHAGRSTDDDDRWAYMRIAAVGGALLSFTKNEGMIVYLPPFLLVAAALLWTWYRSKKIPAATIGRMLLCFAVALIAITIPWLLFKWSHHLTFGNAKPFTSLGIGWQPGVLTSIFINTFFEGNWLLLFPLLFLLFIWRWKTAFTGLIILTAYFLIIYIGQGSLYLFTRLSMEALMQTGYARGLVQLMPVAVLLTTLLLKDVWQPLAKALAREGEIQTG
ncbi:MAG TPA: glycosyltransferase family 39 protein [Candidatus Peribacteraceae bacterium]|nr:glycosyltransferase family 39 protein [Candidatus Peribacteraceae bacterium]